MKPERPDTLTRIHIADPTPIGLFGLAVGCIVLFLVDFEATKGSYMTMPWLFFMPGCLQLFAGFVDLLRHNIFGATAFIVYGVFWMALAVTIAMVCHTHSLSKKFLKFLSSIFFFNCRPD